MKYIYTTGDEKFYKFLRNISFTSRNACNLPFNLKCKFFDYRRKLISEFDFILSKYYYNLIDQQNRMSKGFQPKLFSEELLKQIEEEIDEENVDSIF